MLKTSPPLVGAWVPGYLKRLGKKGGKVRKGCEKKKRERKGEGKAKKRVRKEREGKEIGRK